MLFLICWKIKTESFGLPPNLELVVTMVKSLVALAGPADARRGRRAGVRVPGLVPARRAGEDAGERDRARQRRPRQAVGGCGLPGETRRAGRGTRAGRVAGAGRELHRGRDEALGEGGDGREDSHRVACGRYLASSRYWVVGLNVVAVVAPMAGGRRLRRLPTSTQDFATRFLEGDETVGQHNCRGIA